MPIDFTLETTPEGVTRYAYTITDINGTFIRSGSSVHSIGFCDEYAPHGMTGLQHYTQYADALAYEQISRDVLANMLHAQAEEIERIKARENVPYYLIAVNRSKYPALLAIERAIVEYSGSMRIP